VYGVSVDSVYSHIAFAESLEGLPFELIADFERKMVTDYDVRRDDVAGYAGIPRRSVYVIDGAGTIRWTWLTSPEQRLPDADAVFGEAKKAITG
jgi:peroxiredoxin